LVGFDLFLFNRRCLFSETDLNTTLLSGVKTTLLKNHSSVLLLVIPLAVSAFTHSWNPLGFPSFWYVEEIYLQRAMYVLHGLGVVDPLTTYGHPYDHPYFGQLLLAGLLAIINYPDLLDFTSFTSSSYSTDYNTRDLVYSINLLHLVPRLLIGMLAVFDTFLIYKIAEYNYNNKTIAFIASILFAVMPITWLTRKILLENLALPLLLSSILFAVCFRRSSSIKVFQIIPDINRSILVLISGIFLGLAIFTKLPALAMIPLVGFLIFKSTNKKLKHITLWIIPVVLIPLIWPLDAFLKGEINVWLQDVLWQTQRQGESLLDAFTDFLRIDPVLITLGIVGLVYAEIKRDFLVLFWVVPFIIFLFILGFVSFFYMLLLIPPICIAAARFIEDLVGKINNRKRRRMVAAAIVLPIAAFGLISTTLLVTLNVTSSYLEVYAFVVQLLIQDGLEQVREAEMNSENIGEARTTLIGNSWTRAYYWIPKYIFNTEVDIVPITSSAMAGPTIDTERVILKLDNHILRLLHNRPNHDSPHLQWVRTLNSSTYKIAEFTEESPIFRDYGKYPYSGSMNHNLGIAATEFRVN
jgi:hypothetical protein